MISGMLLTWHNLRVQDLMEGLRAAIAAGTLDDFVAGFHAARAQGDLRRFDISPRG